MSKRVILAAVLAAWSAGCLGTGGVTSKARELNLRAVENRWAREGLYLGMQALWIYRICSVLDLFVFNSIEFWSGTNPINGKRALAEVPRSQVEKMGFKEIDHASVELVSQDMAKLHLAFMSGDRMTLDVLRRDGQYTVSYLGRVFFSGQIESEGWE
jgi:hypothetical protein